MNGNEMNMVGLWQLIQVGDTKYFQIKSKSGNLFLDNKKRTDSSDEKLMFGCTPVKLEADWK